MHESPTRVRDYRSPAGAVRGLRAPATREQRMQAVVDALWDSLHDHGVSWVGFYIDHPENPDDQRLILGPRRDKPACSPIGLHGVCGQALLGRKPVIVRDTAELGDNYVACDPRDRSEVVIPLFDQQQQCWGVLDVDSWDLGAFDLRDADGLQQVLHAAGFMTREWEESRD